MKPKQYNYILYRLKCHYEFMTTTPADGLICIVVLLLFMQD